MKKIAEDTILILTGIPCVGKTSVAYEIIHQYPDFRRVSEMDIIRNIIRAVLNNLTKESHLNEDIVKQEYSDLFESLTVSDFKTTKLQSLKLMPYVKEIILRQQRRKIPTIIEGSGIIPSVFFPNGTPKEWLNSNVIFVNLYISDDNEQKERRHARHIERKYTSDYIEIEKREAIVMSEKNYALHIETIDLSKKLPNVFSIDTAHIPIEKLAKEIIDIVKSYFSINS